LKAPETEVLEMDARGYTPLHRFGSAPFSIHLCSVGFTSIGKASAIVHSNYRRTAKPNIFPGCERETGFASLRHSSVTAMAHLRQNVPFGALLHHAENEIS
jgi:hypothetical protein